MAMREGKMWYILGAPGSGKTAVVAHLRHLLPQSVILDWDALMEPAGLLAGCDISDTEATWSPYAALVRRAVEIADPARVILLGVCTPGELSDWPDGQWLLLDCSDSERTRRLTRRGEEDAAIGSALSDAAEYRSLGLETLDTTSLTAEQTAEAIVSILARGRR